MLAGKPTPIWVSEADMEVLLKGAALDDHKALKGVLTPAPSIFMPRD
jgi:hypothetical protein